MATVVTGPAQSKHSGPHSCLGRIFVPSGAFPVSHLIHTAKLKLASPDSLKRELQMLHFSSISAVLHSLHTAAPSVCVFFGFCFGFCVCLAFAFGFGFVALSCVLLASLPALGADAGVPCAGSPWSMETAAANTASSACPRSCGGGVSGSASQPPSSPSARSTSLAWSGRNTISFSLSAISWPRPSSGDVSS